MSPPSNETVLNVEGVGITSPDKVLDREQGLTKARLAEYYGRIERWILPHLAGRLLTIVRCPDGHDEGCFYQKHPSGSMAEAIHVLGVRGSEGTAEYMWVDDLAGLAGLVQLGALELHVWGSRIDRLDRPDRLVFDLDPGPGVAFGGVVEAARDLRALLEDVDLASFPMATGGKGLHVVVPLDRHHDFDEVRGFAADVARRMQRADPGRYVAQASKHKRRGRVFVDYLRNARGATAICPYSTRARPGAPVATPLRWEELGAETAPDAYDVLSILRRLSRLADDPWREYEDTRQRLTEAAFRAVRASD